MSNKPKIIKRIYFVGTNREFLLESNLFKLNYNINNYY